MRNILFLTFMMISCFCSSQEDKVTIISSKFPTYEGVIAYPEKSKKELYALLKEWIVLKYNSAKDVIQLDDPELGKIIIKGVKSYYLSGSFGGGYENKAYHSITIDIKDNKFKYKIDITDVTSGSANISIMNDVMFSGKTGKIYVKERERQIEQIENWTNSIINDLKNLKTSDNNDW